MELLTKKEEIMVERRHENGYVVQYAYDDAGRVVEHRYPEGNVVRYAYDEEGNSVVEHPDGSVQEYDADGELVQE